MSSLFYKKNVSWIFFNCSTLKLPSAFFVNTAIGRVKEYHPAVHVAHHLIVGYFTIQSQSVMAIFSQVFWQSTLSQPQPQPIEKQNVESFWNPAFFLGPLRYFHHMTRNRSLSGLVTHWCCWGLVYVTLADEDV